MRHGDILKNIINIYKKNITEVATMIGISRVRLGRIMKHKSDPLTASHIKVLAKKLKLGRMDKVMLLKTGWYEAPQKKVKEIEEYRKAIAKEVATLEPKEVVEPEKKKKRNRK